MGRRQSLRCLLILINRLICFGGLCGYIPTHHLACYQHLPSLRYFYNQHIVVETVPRLSISSNGDNHIHNDFHLSHTMFKSVAALTATILHSLICLSFLYCPLSRPSCRASEILSGGGMHMLAKTIYISPLHPARICGSSRVCLICMTNIGESNDAQQQVYFV